MDNVIQFPCEYELVRSSRIPDCWHVYRNDVCLGNIFLGSGSSYHVQTTLVEMPHFRRYLNMKEAMVAIEWLYFMQSLSPIRGENYEECMSDIRDFSNAQ